jgi:hypothetical protein
MSYLLQSRHGSVVYSEWPKSLDAERLPSAARRTISIQAEGIKLLEKHAIAPSAARLCCAYDGNKRRIQDSVVYCHERYSPEGLIENYAKQTFPETTTSDGDDLVKMCILELGIRFTQQALDLSHRFTDKKLAVYEVLCHRTASGRVPRLPFCGIEFSWGRVARTQDKCSKQKSQDRAAPF